VSDLLQALVLGIVEGLTEFLPVSSTGHLLIAEHLMDSSRSEFFNIGIQSGAILAVVLVFKDRLMGLARGYSDPAQRDYLLKLSGAFLVTAVGGLLVKKLGFTLPEAVRPIAIALIVGGVAILAIERLMAGRPEASTVTWKVALWVGISQVVAGVFPGTSRSAATIFSAMLAGVTLRAAATEFAFLVGIPTMFAATAFDLFKLRHTGFAGEDWPAFAVAFVVSAIVAFASVKWLLRYVVGHRFTVFAWYRIVAGIALLLFVH
jgi:undecaprenyl-diphosphatase